MLVSKCREEESIILNMSNLRWYCEVNYIDCIEDLNLISVSRILKFKWSVNGIQCRYNRSIPTDEYVPQLEREIIRDLDKEFKRTKDMCRTWEKYNKHNDDLLDSLRYNKLLLNLEDRTMTTIKNIKNVIYNEPATIVFWGDGTKTVVKCGDNETFDPEKGFAMAVIKKILGNKGNYFNYIKEHTKNYNAIVVEDNE